MTCFTNILNTSHYGTIYTMTMNRKQIIVIHGGDTFDTYEEYLDFLRKREIDFEKYRTGAGDWKQALAGDLGPGYEVFAPAMPNKMNAKYLEWKIWFEKFIPHLNSQIILAGHSLGGTFLAKYLAENTFAKTIAAALLVAPAFDAAGTDYSMGDFIMPDNLDGFQKQAQNIFIYHSQDDPVVPFADLEKFRQRLPEGIIKIFTGRGHFKQEHFPELIKDIKSLP